MKAMNTAATGMDAQVLRIDTIANNLANANTTGFKKSQVDFADLMYEVIHYPGAGNKTQNTSSPTGLEVGSGVLPVSTLRIFTQGALAPTNGQLDMAIQGDGFFQIQMPNGDTLYTRDGNFRINAQGQVVNSLGYEMLPAITVPADAIEVCVGQDGTVSATLADGTTNQIGVIQLVDFINPAGLAGEGGNLFRETDASGAPVTGTAGTAGFGTLAQGYLEQSNVDVVADLVDLITAQRNYELNSKVVKAGDRILQVTNGIVG